MKYAGSSLQKIPTRVTALARVAFEHGWIVTLIANPTSGGNLKIFLLIEGTKERWRVEYRPGPKGLWLADATRFADGLEYSSMPLESLEVAIRGGSR